MPKFARLLLIALAASTATSVARANDDDDCKFSAQREAKIDLQGARKVAITARAGAFELIGVKGATAVSGSGRACASQQDWLDQVQIQTRREGDTVHLNVVVPDTDKAQIGWNNTYATLDLKVRVPDNVAVVATDSSGESEVRNLASLDMTDSSGELRISDIVGELVVRDSSGEITIKNAGSVKLEDSSGDVQIDGVPGNVLVSVDSSGGLTIEHVKGNVTVEQDSSGSIEITDVTGDVRIESDSSGEVDVRRVQGGFSLGSKGSGEVHFADITGPVKVPQR